MKDVTAGFHKALNRHGYGFHYAILKRADELYARQQSLWAFEVSEFPVAVQGEGTRADFILKHRERPHYLVAECKRANPALADWCFARAPYVRRNRSQQHLIAEHMDRVADTTFRAGGKPLAWAIDAYDVALEVRSDAKGDGGQGRGAIEEAATQVSRAMNGLVEFYARHKEVLKGINQVVISPVIFTTAKLWTSDIDISALELSTGLIDLSQVALEPKTHVMYQYHLSPGIKHQHANFPFPSELGDVLDAEYIRTIHVVQIDGLDTFLTYLSSAYTV